MNFLKGFRSVGRFFIKKSLPSTPGQVREGASVALDDLGRHEAVLQEALGLLQELAAQHHHAAGPAKSGAQRFKFGGPKTGPFGPLMARCRLSRRRGWILRVRKRPKNGLDSLRNRLWTRFSDVLPRSVKDS